MASILAFILGPRCFKVAQDVPNLSHRKQRMKHDMFQDVPSKVFHICPRRSKMFNDVHHPVVTQYAKASCQDVIQDAKALCQDATQDAKALCQEITLDLPTTFQMFVPRCSKATQYEFMNDSQAENETWRAPK